jgi:hypothetical protein
MNWQFLPLHDQPPKAFWGHELQSVKVVQEAGQAPPSGEPPSHADAHWTPLPFGIQKPHSGGPQQLVLAWHVCPPHGPPASGAGTLQAQVAYRIPHVPPVVQVYAPPQQMPPP